MCDVSEDVTNNWDTTYSQHKYRPSKAFDGPIDPASNRNLKKGSFRREHMMNAFVHCTDTYGSIAFG